MKMSNRRKPSKSENAVKSRAQRLADGWRRVDAIISPEAAADLDTLIERSRHGNASACVEDAIILAREASDAYLARKS